MIRASVLLACLTLRILTSSQLTTASNAENTIRAEKFLANVNLSDPKVFYVRNDLDGDVVFQENENASLVVHVAANSDKEMERVKVEYNLLGGGAIVDIQVFIVPETTTNWPLVGGLAGAGLVLAVIIVIVVTVVIRKRKKKQQLELAAKREQLEMRDRGKVVAEKVAVFDNPDGWEEKTLGVNVFSMSCTRPVQRSLLIEKKMATFGRLKRKEETDGECEETGLHRNEEMTPLKLSEKSGTCRDQTPQNPQLLSNPRRQTSKFLSARAAFLVLTLVTVALATSKVPTARIVINVPPHFVKNGSKIFFNEDFHGRLLLSGGLKPRMQAFEQFAVSQASSKVSSLDPCSTSCKFACDVQTQQCICRRGYEMEGGSCHDMDECTNNKHNCHAQSTCSNAIGGFTCTCNDGFWGDGVTCHACSTKPCPEGFYQSKSCTRTRDRVCAACSPKCDRMTYQAYGCGLTFDRKCVDISKPLTMSKAPKESDSLDVRSGSKLIVLNPNKNLVLLEDRLKLNSTSTTFLLRKNSPNRTLLYRNSSFYVDVEIEQVNIVPEYKDYDAWRANENHEFALVSGFPEVFSKHCRYPAPNHYTIKHDLERNRQTKVYPTTCFEHSRSLCPNDVAPGETYHYRSLNDACDKAEESVICQKPNQRDCMLQEDPSKLYCTNYTNIVSDVFGVQESEFLESPLQSFPTVLCAEAYRSCRICRDACSSCDRSNSRSDSSCSCCYKDCLEHCKPFYILPNCTQIPKQCAKGDTSRFTLAMDKPSNLNLQFNCFLEHEFPKILYTLKYRVQHASGRFNSSWISKALKTPQADDNPRSKIQQGINRLDSLEISHSTNFHISPLLYLRAQRKSDEEPFKYSVSSLVDDDTTLGNANAAKTIDVQTKTPFSITTRSWSNGENCERLSEWSQTLRKPFRDLMPAKVENLGVEAGGRFSYHIHDPQRLPTMTVSISEDESILKYILTNASIRNDETFQSSLSRGNTTWNAKISGVLTSCPGFFTLQVIDEVDDVKVLEKDVVILCPETGFKIDIHVPRMNFQDKERLFSIFLSNAKQKLKLQLAVVDKASRKGKEAVKKSDDEKPDPWITLMPLFVVTGCVLLSLFALITYAQITHKPDDDVKDGPSGWKMVKNKDTKVGKGGNKRKKTQPKDENRLKRRHLILVVFFVVIRVVYSLVFTFSMAFAILTLLHGPNMKIIQEYQDFVQRKVDESNAMALRMDQHREGENKRVLDSSEDIQRSCDFYLGLQLQWLRYNMTCLIQENHLKMFNRLSKKIVKKVTEKVQKLKKDIEERMKKFQGRTKRELQDTKDRLKNYGRRVYDNGWFALPRGAYAVKKATGRKRRDMRATNESYLQKQEYRVHENERERGLPWKTQNAFSTRAKRSIADSSFIGFLDFVGAIDQDKLVETENKIKAKLRYAKNGLADFSEVLKTGKSPEHPLSTILMCPLRFMLKSAMEQTKKGIRKIAEEGEEWARGKAACFMGNVSDFHAANDSILDFNGNETDSEFFSERIMYEEGDGLDGIGNVSEANKSSLIESARGGSYYNIEKGDIMEEQVDEQKKELLEKEERYKNVTGVYDADVFFVTKKAVLGVVVIIDILLLIYRGSKTYKIAFSLIQGFEETVRHDEDEFQDKQPATKKPAERLVRRVLDFLSEKFSKFLTFCKTLHKKVMRTNLLPMCIIIAASAAILYLLIAVVFNVMNVTVVEELGGYDLIASRLDTDYNFTNLAIADQVDFINNNDMRLYKESMNESLSEYNRMTADFNRDQRERIERLNRQLCSLENDTDKCLKGTGLSASLLSFDPQSCIIPTLEGIPYEDYDGEAYRQRLKHESKRFVDAIRNIVLETIYFILGVVLSVIVISVLSYVVFLFLKSRGMVRVKYVHVYKTLPDDILAKFHLKSPESEDEQDGNNISEKGDNQPKKLKVPTVFLTESQENVNTFKRESKA